MSSKSGRQPSSGIDSHIEAWRIAIEREDFIEALTHAVGALRVAAKLKDIALQKAAMGYVESTIGKTNLTSSSAEPASQVACSFCGRTRDQARLVVGAEGRICEYCVANVVKFFRDDDSKSNKKKA